MAAVKIQHKNCLQSTLRKKIINTSFAGLGRGKNCALCLGYGPRPAALGRTEDLWHSFSQYGPPGRQITCLLFSSVEYFVSSFCVEFSLQPSNVFPVQRNSEIFCRQQCFSCSHILLIETLVNFSNFLHSLYALLTARPRASAVLKIGELSLICRFNISCRRFVPRFAWFLLSIWPILLFFGGFQVFVAAF